MHAIATLVYVHIYMDVYVSYYAFLKFSMYMNDMLRPTIFCLFE